MTGARRVVTTAAKLNLSLEVLGRREDGFHELRTVFQTIDPGDRLEAEPAPELSLEVDDPSIPAGPENLVLRAAEALRAEAGVAAGARLRLSKSIPAGGGLGGGSGDAAAALVLLDRLWGLRSSPERLHRLAARLGSDVPFFLLGGTALGLGRGERLEPLGDLPARELLLVIPPVHLSTPRVYGEFARVEGLALTSPGAAPTIPAPRQDRPGASASFPAINHLEPAVFRLEPSLRDLRDRLLSLGASEARVTGSGACLFALFGAQGIPEGIERELPPGVGSRRCRFLPRGEYRERLAGGGEGTGSGGRGAGAE